MTRLQSAHMQCCMCITGVFMFLGGVVMLATGITLLLNYNVFEVNPLPPLENTDQGKKTAAIILTCFGLVGILISVIVSVLFLCTKSKTPAIVLRELSQMPPTTRGATPVKGIHSDRIELSDRKHSNGTKLQNNSNVKTRAKKGNIKNIPGSAEVKLPRITKTQRRNHHYGRRVQRLEGIKENDAISRKTLDDVRAASDCRDTASLSSEMTIDDQHTIPQIVTASYDDLICQSSLDSASPSQASDISNNKSIDVNQSRRQLQCLPESAKNKDLSEQYDTDPMSSEHYREAFIDRRINSEDHSINNNTSQNQVTTLTDFDEFFPDGNNETGTVSSSLADMTDSDKA